MATLGSCWTDCSPSAAAEEGTAVAAVVRAFSLIEPVAIRFEPLREVVEWVHRSHQTRFHHLLRHSMLCSGRFVIVQWSARLTSHRQLACSRCCFTGSGTGSGSRHLPAPVTLHQWSPLQHAMVHSDLGSPTAAFASLAAAVVPVGHHQVCFHGSIAFVGTAAVGEGTAAAASAAGSRCCTELVVLAIGFACCTSIFGLVVFWLDGFSLNLSLISFFGRWGFEALLLQSYRKSWLWPLMSLILSLEGWPRIVVQHLELIPWWVGLILQHWVSFLSSILFSYFHVLILIQIQSCQTSCLLSAQFGRFGYRLLLFLDCFSDLLQLADSWREHFEVTIAASVATGAAWSLPTAAASACWALLAVAAAIAPPHLCLGCRSLDLQEPIEIHPLLQAARLLHQSGSSLAPDWLIDFAAVAASWATTAAQGEIEAALRWADSKTLRSKLASQQASGRLALEVGLG